MAILNENGNLPDHFVESFQGSPARVLVANGTALYKFSGISITQYPMNADISPWWSSVKETPAFDWGLDNTLKVAAAMRTTPSELARATVAISNQWEGETEANVIKYIVTITLDESVYGWHGPATPMPKNQANQSTANYPGTWYQYCIPNLRMAHLSSVWSQPTK